MTLGPLEYIVIGFEGNKFDGSIAREIEKVVEKKIIRLVDVVFVATDADGDARHPRARQQGRPALRRRSRRCSPTGWACSPRGPRATIAESPAARTPSGLALLFEHRWAEDIKDAMGAAGGFLVGRVVIPPEILEEVAPSSRPRPSRLADPTTAPERRRSNEMMRRRGRPLMRAAATTAVVAGTAGAVRHHQEQKYANQAAEQQAEQQAAAPAARRRTAAPVAPLRAPAAGIDMEQLKQLGELHTAGVLSDEEFAAAKAKLLGV